MHNPFILRAAPGLPFAVLACLSVMPALALAFDGARLLQVMVLSLSAWLWLGWPLHNGRARTMQALAAGGIGIAFLLDATVRVFILRTYGATPDSTIVTTALANTSRAEAAEFMLAYWPGVLQGAAMLLISTALLGTLLWRWRKVTDRPMHVSHWRRIAFFVLLLLLLVALTIKPSRKHHPFVFWPSLAQQVADTRARWHGAHQHTALLKQRAAAQEPTLTPSSPDTLVLVISDSINRHHLSLYGYARPTTPKLAARQAQESHSFKVFRHPWSADASTVFALNNFFHFGEPANPQRDHLLALAGAAGYKTWWISNHDDLAVDLQHAQLADSRHMLNHIPGRSTTSLDHAVLPELEMALNDTHRRKLIVVHLLGAHPHYRLRHPPEHAPFRNVQDAVDHDLKSRGRSARTRELRNDYDSAIHFHDRIADHTLELTRRLGGNAGWIFLSDHGQEVGGVRNHTGHSTTSPDGYRIPLLAWGPVAHRIPDELQHVLIRSDWLGHSITRLLGITWKSYRPERDFLDSRYRWSPPPHPIRVDYLS